MFGVEETVSQRIAAVPSLMKEEPLGGAGQLTPVRNWMQPTVVDQGGGRFV